MFRQCSTCTLNRGCIICLIGKKDLAFKILPLKCFMSYLQKRWASFGIGLQSIVGCLCMSQTLIFWHQSRISKGTSPDKGSESVRNRLFVFYLFWTTFLFSLLGGPWPGPILLPLLTLLFREDLRDCSKQISLFCVGTMFSWIKTWARQKSVNNLALSFFQFLGPPSSETFALGVIWRSLKFCIFPCPRLKNADSSKTHIAL